MVISTIFKIMSVTLLWPVHLSMLSWSSCNQYSVLYPIQLSYWLLFHMTIVKTMDSSEKGMNPVLMTNIILYMTQMMKFGIEKL